MHYFVLTLILLMVFVTGFVAGMLASPGDVVIRQPDDVPYPVKKPVEAVRTEPPARRH